MRDLKEVNKFLETLSMIIGAVLVLIAVVAAVAIFVAVAE